MGNFNRNNRSGRGRDSGGPSMHQAICAECGNSCEVPFKPRGDKPVYCSNCFEHQGGGNRRSERSDFREKQMFPATCNKCGNKCEVPFRPSGGKPVYCSDCFGSGAGKKQPDRSGSSKAQFDIINAKLDQILKALTPSAALKPAPKEGTAKKPANGKKVEKPKKAAQKITAKKLASRKKK